MSLKKKPKDIELSQEEFDTLLVDIEEFDNNVLIYLAQSDRFEIIPTSDENGKTLSKDSLSHLHREVERLGYKAVYKIDKPNGETILLNMETLKVMVLVEGMQ